MHATRVAQAFVVASLIVHVAAAAKPSEPGAGPSGEEGAVELADEAMDTLYAAADFKGAAAALQRAIRTCGTQCSPAVTARLNRDLGVVTAVGLKQPWQAEALFRKAVKADPTITLDPDLAEETARALFAKAGGNVIAMAHEPIVAQKRRVPIPIFVRVTGNTEGTKVQLLYRVEGTDKWNGAQMKPHSDGFAATIGCKWVQKEGVIEYFIRVQKDDKDVARVGSKTEPLRVEISRRSPDSEPALPGEDPPEACAAPSRKGRKPERRESRRPSMWMSLQIAQDFAVLGGDDVCGAAGQEEGFYCFRGDDQQYLGTPLSSDVSTGLAVATTRLLAGFDVVAGSRVSIGVGAGYAFGGGPRPTGGSDFLPWHLEARTRIFVLSKAYAEDFGIFLSLGAGLAQVDVAQELKVLENVNAPVSPSQTDNPPSQTLTVWKKMGRGFVAPGLGVWLPIGKAGGITGTVDARLLFPGTGFSLAPGVGYSLGF